MEKFWAINSYVAGSYTEESAFKNLNSEMSKLEAGKEAGNRLFYLALPPSVFADVTTHIKATCMSKKLVITKVVNCIWNGRAEYLFSSLRKFTGKHPACFDNYIEHIGHLFNLNVGSFRPLNDAMRGIQVAWGCSYNYACLIL